MTNSPIAIDIKGLWTRLDICLLADPRFHFILCVYACGYMNTCALACGSMEAEAHLRSCFLGCRPPFFICFLFFNRASHFPPASCRLGCLCFPRTGIASAGHQAWLFMQVLRMDLRSSCRTDSHFLCPSSVSFLFLQTREVRSGKDAPMHSSSPQALSLWHVAHPISRGWQDGRVVKE